MASGFFMLFGYLAVSGPDSAQYDKLGWNLAQGRGFSLESSSPFIPTMFREPGYPAILSVVYAVLGHNVAAVLALQAVMHALTAILAFMLSSEIFGDGPAFASGIAVAVFPTLANMSACMLSETFFTFTLCLGVWLLYVTVIRRRAFSAIVCGAVLGVAGVTKAAALFLPIVLVIVVLLISAVRKRADVRLVSCLVAVVLISYAPASAWSMRNQRLFNTGAITLRGGEALWSRAQKLNDTSGAVAATACYSFSEYLGAKLFPAVTDKPERYLFKDFDRAVKIREDLRTGGRSDVDIDAIFRNEAVSLISERPFRYIAYTLVEAIKMTAFTYLPVLNEPSVQSAVSRRFGPAVLSATRGAARILAYPLMLLAFAALFVHAGRWEQWMPIVSVIAYFGIVYSMLDAIGRYAVPLVPFYCVLAVSVFFRNKMAGETGKGI